MFKDMIMKIALKKGAEKFVQAIIAQLPFITGILKKAGIDADIKIDEAVMVAAVIAALEVARNYLKHKK